jgi:hypothetical protein
MMVMMVMIVMMAERRREGEKEKVRWEGAWILKRR